MVHYELEFIHPCSDGNGRMGRLWQTAILSKWRTVFAYLPVETVIHEKRREYYRMLGRADKGADAAPFIEFILAAICDALLEVTVTDQVSDQVSDQVKRLLGKLAKRELSAADLMQRLGLSHRPTFRKNYLGPALDSGLVERTNPDSPRSPKQRYRLTESGRRFWERL